MSEEVISVEKEWVLIDEHQNVLGFPSEDVMEGRIGLLPKGVKVQRRELEKV